MPCKIRLPLSIYVKGLNKKGLWSGRSASLLVLDIQLFDSTVGANDCDRRRRIMPAIRFSDAFPLSHSAFKVQRCQRLAVIEGAGINISNATGQSDRSEGAALESSTPDACDAVVNIDSSQSIAG